MARPVRPNVVWILCDELRADAVAAYGNHHADIRTPNIDRIAESGTRFDRFYVSSPVCVSSRVALATGRLPTSTGIYHNEGSFLTPEQPERSFVDRLGDAGYVTVNLGKEHVPAELAAFGHSDDDGADQAEMMLSPHLGRDVEAIGVHAATWPAGVAYPPSRLTEHALSWLHRDRPEDAPWLLRVSYLQPHTPVAVPEPWASVYADAAWPDRFVASPGLSRYERAFADAAGSHDFEPGQIVAAQARYHGVVRWIDDQIGLLLDAIDELGMRENTIVVFASDHGAQLGELGGAYGKMTFSRHSHRIPFMISWPDSLPVAQVDSSLSHGVDLAPTVLDLVGLEPAGEHDGRRLFTDPPPDAIVSAIGYGNPGGRALAMRGEGAFPGGFGWPQRFCVRTDRFRYDRSTRRDGETLSAHDHDAFLADLQNDPDEVVNVVNDPELGSVVDGLESMLAVRFADAAQIDPDRYEVWKTRRDAYFAERWGARR